MALDLPPVIPPQLSTAERIEAYAPASAVSAFRATIEGRELIVTGNRYLSEEQLRTLTSAAQTPSQAIRAINQAYYQLGHLLVTVYYAPRGNGIHVHVVNAGLADIEGPATIRAHFDDLIGDKDLTTSEFDTRRVLANLKSERSGVDYSISYRIKDGNPEAYTMVFTPQAVSDHDATDLILQLSNQGNRFLGRYFGGAGVKHRFSTGSELALNYEAAITEWGETNGGKSYDGLSLQFNHPSSFGLYGLEGSYVEYEREALLAEPVTTPGTPVVDVGGSLICLLGGLLGLPCNPGVGVSVGGSTSLLLVPVVIEAEVSSLALTGEQVLYSDSAQRFTVSQRLEHIETEIDVVGRGLLLDEPHTSLELGAKYFRQMRLLGAPARFNVQAFIEGGLSSDDGSLGTDTTEDAVSIGKRTAEYLMLRPKLAMQVGLTDALALNLDFAGQLSDDEQLPQQQQFVLGGISTLSAYLPAVLVGDSGTYTRLSLEGSGWELWGATFKPSLFVEHGQAWYENAGGDAADTRSISDGGVRLVADLGWQTEMELVAAAPISESNIDQAVLDEAEADFYWKLKKTF